MPGEISITIAIRWKWEHGEGLLCANCGNAAWLKHVRMVAVIDGMERPQNVILCESCGRRIENLNDNGL